MRTSKQRQYLLVPFADKDLAKELGAKYDGKSRRWYVPARTKTAPFLRWIENVEDSVVDGVRMVQLPYLGPRS